MLVWLFWMSALAIVYAYAGYPLVLILLTRLRGRELPVRPQTDAELPGVTMIVPVHNERGIIDEKLANTEALEYPADRLEVLFVSDASSDGTTEAIAARSSERIRLLELQERGGKAAGLNAGLAAARHDIIVFSDGSILLDPESVRTLVLPFQHPVVGCVSGEDWIPDGGGEGLYGRYELSLRRLESGLGSIVGASGSFYAQRRLLCDQFIPNAAPDFLSVLLTVSRGYRALTCCLVRAAGCRRCGVPATSPPQGQNDPAGHHHAHGQCAAHESVHAGAVRVRTVVAQAGALARAVLSARDARVERGAGFHERLVRHPVCRTSGVLRSGRRGGLWSRRPRSPARLANRVDTSPP